MGTAIVALGMGLGLVVIMMFAGGRPSDLKSSGGWQVWLVLGLVVFTLLFLLGRSLHDMGGG